MENYNAVLTKNYYLVQVHDLPTAQRAKHMPAHMEYAIPLTQSGRVGTSISGYLAPSHSAGAQLPDVIGQSGITFTLDISSTAQRHMLKRYLVMAGGFLPKTVQSSEPGSPKKVSGSFMVIQADTAEQAFEALTNDPLWKSEEVWDRETVTVTPVFVAMPKIE